MLDAASFLQITLLELRALFTFEMHTGIAQGAVDFDSHPIAVRRSPSRCKPASRTAPSTSACTRLRYAFYRSRLIVRSSGPICIQRSAFLPNICRSAGGIAIHRSRGLFTVGTCRGGAILRAFE